MPSYGRARTREPVLHGQRGRAVRPRGLQLEKGSRELQPEDSLPSSEAPAQPRIIFLKKLSCVRGRSQHTLRCLPALWDLRYNLNSAQSALPFLSEHVTGRGEPVPLLLALPAVQGLCQEPTFCFISAQPRGRGHMC